MTTDPASADPRPDESAGPKSSTDRSREHRWRIQQGMALTPRIPYSAEIVDLLVREGFLPDRADHYSDEMICGAIQKKLATPLHRRG